MKRFFLIIILFLVSVSHGQDTRGMKETYKEAPKERKVIASVPGGYENVAWGVRLSDARDRIKGKLVYTDDKSIIISKDGDLEYYYGFFYIDPALESADAAKNAAEKKETEPKEGEKKTDGAEKVDEGKLFYVALKFPYLSMDEVKKKIEAKYGPSTNENLHKMQGAVAWNGENTIVIMWVDRYENKPFCRRITYVDKKITKELSDYQFKVFNRVELAILRQLGL
ncbi:MAG TPA: hypothetical protein PLC28_06760 [Spirochaetota bacterium]|nr:hypothetical protein [Spirochaetota bacterium]HQJ70511.1 hypothetical protein [Spirochaetota bacterium]